MDEGDFAAAVVGVIVIALITGVGVVIAALLLRLAGLV